jgi:acetyltransferase-like isoleucine patch superfamily enzyme
MKSFKGRIYSLALGRDREAADVQIGLGQMLYYLWKRGGRSRIHGALVQHRFKQCGGRLFVGRSIDILFPRHISLGRNVYLGDYSYINGLSREGFRLGNNVRIREHAWIQATSSLEDLGEGLKIGDDTYIGPRCIIGAGGGINIGSNVTMGAGVELLAENHRFEDIDLLISEQGVTRQGINIENNVWLGNRVIVLDGIRIGTGAVVGAGSVVTRDLPPYSIAVGNPARVMGNRRDEKGLSEAV